ncbi:MAG: hypothetical protein ACOX7N_02080 [Lawsonibacter sp.]
MKPNYERFETLISNAMQSRNSEVYFTRILIANKDSSDEFYIDPRTWTRADGLKVVLPICYHGGFDWYICPDCGQLHPAYGYGKRETGCCNDTDYGRIQRIGNDYIFIQRDPIVIEENLS